MINIKCKKIIPVIVIGLTMGINGHEVKENIVDINTSQKCISRDCEQIKNDILVLVEEKLDQVSTELQKHDINETTIKLKINKLIDNVSEASKENSCFNMFKKVIKTFEAE